MHHGSTHLRQCDEVQKCVHVVVVVVEVQSKTMFGMKTDSEWMRVVVGVAMEEVIM